MNKKEHIMYKKRALKIAQQLCYSNEVVEAISKAKTEFQISLILSRVRNS